MKTSIFLTPGALVSHLEKAIESSFPTVAKNAIKLLDIGAGTGLCGEKCVDRGYTNLVAIDLSPSMLAIAEKRNIYKSMVCDSLYNWRKHFNAGQFDVAFTSSVFTPGQLKPLALDEIICLVKPGKVSVDKQSKLLYPNRIYRSTYTHTQKLKQYNCHVCRFQANIACEASARKRKGRSKGEEAR